MKTLMKVDFEDIEENWRLWGELVELWIFKLQPWPTDTAKLVNQMTAHGIKGASVYGKPRKVEFYQYDDDAPLAIMLPTAEMVTEGRKKVHPGHPYPLPVFYNGAYTGPRKVLTADEETLLMACRIGEYTINMCQ